MERFDDKCAVRLNKAWCCEETDGKEWKFVHGEFEMKIMNGGKCIGCHYKIGGAFDENGTHYMPNKRAREKDAMLAFRCRDVHRHIDSGKVSKIAYIRRYDSNDTDIVVHAVAMLTCKERFRDMCVERLSKSWCCDKKWKLAEPGMRIMEGDKCKGCSYKIGGELDGNGTNVTVNIDHHFNETTRTSTLLNKTGSTYSRTFNMNDHFNVTMNAFTLFDETETGLNDSGKIAYVLPIKSPVTDDAVLLEVASWA